MNKCGVWLGVCAVGVLLLLSFMAGVMKGVAVVRQEAVSVGAAHWVVESQDNPRVMLEWNTQLKVANK